MNAFLPLSFAPPITYKKMQDIDSSSEPLAFLHFCPHCGSDKFAAVSSREFKCGDCGFDFFVNSAAAVVAIITDEDGRIMLTRRAREPRKGWLDLPGGFVDPGESAEEAVRREIREELEVEVTHSEFFCSYPNEYIYSNYKVRTTDLAFVCETDKVPTLCADDVEEIVWMHRCDIDLDKIAFTSIRNILAKVLASRA